MQAVNLGQRVQNSFHNDTHYKRTSRSNSIWLICYMLSHHMHVHWQSQQSLSALCCMQVEQIQFTIAKTVTHHCEQQLVSLVFVVPVLWLWYSNMAPWCEQRRMHSWAYRPHRHPINWCVSNAISEMCGIFLMRPLLLGEDQHWNAGLFWINELLFRICKSNTFRTDLALRLKSTTVGS